MIPFLGYALITTGWLILTCVAVLFIRKFAQSPFTKSKSIESTIDATSKTHERETSEVTNVSSELIGKIRLITGIGFTLITLGIALLGPGITTQTYSDIKANDSTGTDTTVTKQSWALEF